LDDTAGLEELFEWTSARLVACANELITARSVATFFVFRQARNTIAAQLIVRVDAETFAS